MINEKEIYLGDGLYAHHDGYQIVLRAPRELGDHYVALEPQVLDAFMRFVAHTMHVHIQVTRLGDPSDGEALYNPK